MTMIHEHDFGTPASNKAQQVSLEIDGESVTVPADTSIMRAASIAGIDIPKLCSTDRLKAFGSCRLCVIQVDGRNGTPSSCTTPVEME